MSNKASLMASLTGDFPVESEAEEAEEDLFGEIPLEEEPAPPPAVTPQPMPAPAAAPPAGQLIVDNPLDYQNPLSMSMPVPPTQPAVSSKKSMLLASSGLLSGGGGGDTNGSSGGGGGLFDEVDKEEEERQRLEDQKRVEEQRRMQEEEQRRLQAEEERRRQAEEQMMQTVNLSSSVAAYPNHQQQNNQQQQQYQQNNHQQQYEQQQQQQNNQQQQYQQQQQQNQNNQQQQQMMPQVTHQVQNMSMSTPTPMSFAERSQMMQVQQATVSQYMTPAPPMHHQQQQQSRDTFSPAGFYRPDPISSPSRPSPLPNQPNTFVYSNAGGDVQTHSIAPSMASSMSRLPHSPTPSATVGMHNSIGRHIRPLAIVQPTPYEPIYGHVAVSEPLLVQPPSLFNVIPPHWTYQVQTTLKGGGCWLVRRRFRHLVALEDRLREEIPGAILPPRPDKHATRAIEEASAMQSAEFAMQRASEMQVYLNAVVHHPYAGKGSSLKLFLALQDDMGTAWPEVSSNALTRLGAVSGQAVQNVQGSPMPWDSNAQDALEDNAELLSLQNSEGIRMGAVTQAVPKLEGSITLLREHGESAGAVGMEMGKLSKAVEASDRDLGVPIEILSQGLLRYGRRQKRLALELSAAMNPFVSQYKMCKYEKMAFHDRRASLSKRVKERGRADTRAQKLMVHQRNLVHQGALGELDRLERDASYSDGMAVGAVHHCDIIGATLKSEVNRIAFERRTEWSKSMKVLCSSLREATAEQTSIWESTKESFLQAFPEYNTNAGA